MKHKNLITELSHELTPIKTVSYGLKEYLMILIGALINGTLGYIILKSRTDLSLVITKPSFILETLILIFLTLSSIDLTVKLSVPGNARKIHFIIPAVLLLSWISIITFRMDQSPLSESWIDPTCVRDIFLGGSIPMMILLLYTYRGAPLFRSYSGLSIFLSGASVGALASQFLCKDSEPFHLLGFHALPLISFATFGLLFGLVSFKKI